MIITIKDVVNGFAFLISIIMLIYGFRKGYDILELINYDLYLILVIIAFTLTFYEKIKGV